MLLARALSLTIRARHTEAWFEGCYNLVPGQRGSIVVGSMSRKVEGSGVFQRDGLKWGSCTWGCLDLPLCDEERCQHV